MLARDARAVMLGSRTWLGMLAAALALLLVAASPRVATACVCLGPEGQVPDDEQGAVSLDAEILRVGVWSEGPVALVTDGAEPLPLAGELLRVAGGGLGRLLIPAGTLQPLTSYTLRFGDPGAPSVETTFRTGSADAVNLAPPAVPAIIAWRLAHAPWVEGQVDTCGDERQDVDLAVALDRDAVAYDVRIVGPDLDVSYVMLPGELRGLGASSCEIPLVARAAAEYCVTLRARNLAGALSPPATACTQNRTCAPIDPADEGDLFACERAGGCSAGAGPMPASTALWPLAALVLAVRSRRGDHRRRR